MGLFKNIKASIDDKSSMSTNSITLLVSALMGAIIGIVLCFVLIYDVTYDGKVDTDMSDLAWFIVAGSSCILGSGLPKAYTDSRMKTRSWVDGEKLQIDAEAEVDEYRKSRKVSEEVDDKEEKK
jgi:hypothetical protein